MISERDEIISRMSPEELWMFHSIGGRVPFSCARRRVIVGTVARTLDAVVQHELKAASASAERTQPERTPEPLPMSNVA